MLLGKESYWNAKIKIIVRIAILLLLFETWPHIFFSLIVGIFTVSLKFWNLRDIANQFENLYDVQNATSSKSSSHKKYLFTIYQRWILSMNVSNNRKRALDSQWDPQLKKLFKFASFLNPQSVSVLYTYILYRWSDNGASTIDIIFIVCIWDENCYNSFIRIECIDSSMTTRVHRQIVVTIFECACTKLCTLENVQSNWIGIQV